MSSRTILEMSNIEARAYLKKGDSYVNFETPPYINFDQLITFCSAFLAKKTIKEVCKREGRKYILPSRFDDVNFTILSNKDGAYSWRPMQIIHPLVYVEFVNLLTKEENWKKLIEWFRERDNSCVDCISMPRESLDVESDRAWQITNWWESIEQETIKQALRYNYLAVSDITDCYGSIYTHVFEWALDEDGYVGAKERKKNSVKSTGLGSQIDMRLQSMNSAQTNGIPQGSTLMDFLAEVILGYGDILLTAKLDAIDGIQRSDFKILRYKDDYRILAINPSVAKKILKELDIVLYKIGLKMSPSKTKTGSDVIDMAIKPEKMEMIYTAPAYLHFQKRALRIYQLSSRHPNSGILMKELGAFYDDFVRVRKSKKLAHVDEEVLISVFTQTAIKSPRAIPLIAGIISKLLERCDEATRVQLTKDIIKKLRSVPNAGFLDMWMQRISEPMRVDIDYDNVLTKIVTHELDNSVLWNSEWLIDEAIDYINTADVSSLPGRMERNEISYVIDREEFELYRLGEY